jgi:preprotein translocase subunit YajC
MQNMLGIILYMGFFFAVMYLLIIRPQKKRDKQMADMQQSIKVGDSVLLNSGFYGKVVDIINDLFVIEFGLNKGVRIPVKKSAILGVAEPDLTIHKNVVAEEEDDDYEDDDDEDYEDDEK